MSHPYTLIRSLRSTVSLQIKRGGEIVVRAPHLYPRYLIDRFVESKERWLEKRINEQAKTMVAPTPFCTEDELKILIQKQITHYSTIMSLSPRSLRFTHVRTYWGSCGPTGVISFNLKLVETSPEAVEYVVVHELAHLRWRGHGVRFWEMVKKYYPQVAEIKKELRHFPRD
ncbi:DUF45 domain-containing protein [Candidatus Woesebacteria bacterium]|nr:DUF45 domain-containing protein [Candidatus Woesebacteria bacterium]